MISARLFTPVGFEELVETHLSIFCFLLFFVVFIKSPLMGGSLIK